MNPATGTVLRDEHYRLDSQIVATYRREWATEDIRFAPLLAAPVGKPQNERALMPMRRWERSAVYNDFLHPSDCPYFLATWLHKSQHRVVALSFEASRLRGPFDASDAQAIERLVPHVRRAFDIRCRLEDNALHTQALAKALDGFHRPVLVLDQVGRVLEMSDAARRVLVGESVVSIGNDHVFGVEGASGLQLARLLNDRGRKGAAGGATLRVVRGAGRQSLTVS